MSNSLERLTEKCKQYNIDIYPHMRYEEPMLLLIEKMEELERAIDKGYAIYYKNGGTPALAQKNVLEMGFILEKALRKDSE